MGDAVKLTKAHQPGWPWPRWFVRWAMEGDLLAWALTGVPPDPECRVRQILRRRAQIRAEDAALGDELFLLTERLKTPAGLSALTSKEQNNG